MRDKSQVVLPLDLEICIEKEDFVFTLAEICESLNYDKLFGTANANKYTFVWKKAVEKNLVKLQGRIETRVPIICERY